MSNHRPNHNHYRGNTPAWRRDIHILTSIFRLRAAPPVPYPLITAIIYEHFEDFIVRFYVKSVNSSFLNRGGSQLPSPSSGTNTEVQESMSENDGRNVHLKPIAGGAVVNVGKLLLWLEEYLTEQYVYAERWGGEAFLQAIGKDETIVVELMDVCGLFERGYRVRAEGEMRVQVKWMREGCWRFGSVPVDANGRWVGGVVESEEGGKVGSVDEAVEDVNEELLRRLRELEVVVPSGTVGGGMVMEWPTMGDVTGHIQHSKEKLSSLVLLIQSQFETTSVSPVLTAQSQLARSTHQDPAPTSTPLPAPVPLTIKSSLVDPSTGRNLDFHSHAHPTRIPTSNTSQAVGSSGIESSKASLMVRLQSRWNGFSDQVDEIKALEAKLKR